MGKRRRSRELAIKVLFHLEFSRKDDPAQAFDLICNNFGVSKDIEIFSKELVLGVCVHLKELDNLISKTSQNWRLERIARVDRSILRLAVYELLYRGDIPPKVSINEAVDLGKKFGTEESGAFINGILDTIYTSLSKTSQNIGPGEIK
ncbi:MAG: transcription antitermination factor NusB [Deltaproteobacteria bacterium]|nr:transcription antitermination factor NusB [Deltaproteobacteria bacterium]MBW2105416.1 transcription antitermination factor NusB [Deltaproteobacteria bacterium]MCD6265899.1 transcription antitermination factor NusB [Deltaproteobacteria bacterium]RLB18698.1 MAG: transcription antitermination factor NusB [Deltaproteobacteria bacterium]